MEGSESYKMAIDIAGEYLAEVHAKNAWYVPEKLDGYRLWKYQSSPLRDGVVNWPEVIKCLKAAGYDDWIIFEDFSTEQPLLDRLTDNLKWFRELTA
jgi:sugar phosphate isomerase/epimerase